jgi:hypothetical protein
MHRVVAILALLLVALAPSAASARAWAQRPTVAQTLAAARALGVGDDAARLKGRFLPGAALTPGGAASSRTHLGGAPDLPRSTAWPTCHGGHRLSLLLQLDVAALARAVPGATRARGTLAVFASQVVDPLTGMPEIDPWAGWLSGGKCFRVLFTPAGARPAHRATPRGVKAFKKTPLRLRPTLTVPDYLMAEELLGHDVGDGWLELATRAAAGDLSAHGRDAETPWQALGWAQPIQQDPTSRYGCVSAHQPKGPKRLLVQVNATDDLDFDDTVGGQLDVTIPAADLRAGRFDRLCGEYQFD